MAWIQVSLRADDALEITQMEQALLATGALSVTFQDAGDQPILEPEPGETPLWSQAHLIGLYPADINLDNLQTALEQELNLTSLPGFHTEILEDREWSRTWMDHFKPMSFGDRLWVCPAGMTPSVPDTINLILDPGLAFGTGTHPTTALCLNWLDQHDCSGQVVLDYGCGSGILAIAALKLGARHVYAVDIDPQALQATRDNAHKNGVSDQIEIMQPHQLNANLQVDLIIANILAGPLKALAPELSQRCKAGGQLLLSGILEEQQAEVQKAYEDWFDFQSTRIQEQWVCLEAQRKSAKVQSKQKKDDLS